jgi:uncharacterized protein YggE
MKTRLRFLSITLLLVLVLSACSLLPQPAPPLLTVTGTGTISLTPDIAYIYIGVHTEQDDINLAVDQNNTQARALVNAIKDQGVASDDIQTSNFSVYSSQKLDPIKGEYNGYTYSVDNTVYVTLRDLSTLGALLNAVVEAGANNINSITFDVADKSAALVQARQKAMENASSLASELAQSAGLQLGGIQSITYTDYYPSPYYGMGGGGATAPNASVPIQPGQQQVTVSVTVAYAVH